jgi:hypothetical protein
VELEVLKFHFKLLNEVTVCAWTLEIPAASSKEAICFAFTVFPRVAHGDAAD